MKKKCVVCGAEFDAREEWHTKCYGCLNPSRSQGGGRGGGGINRVNMPSSLSRQGGSSPSPPADTFLNTSGYPREEIYLSWAEEKSAMFDREGMTQTSMRRLFNMLKQAQMRLHTDKNFEAAKVVLFEFVRLVEYNNRRKGQRGPIIPDCFKQFVEDHLAIAKKNAQEFSAFVEYLTSIMARMKQK